MVAFGIPPLDDGHVSGHLLPPVCGPLIPAAGSTGCKRLLIRKAATAGMTASEKTALPAGRRRVIRRVIVILDLADGLTYLLAGDSISSPPTTTSTPVPQK
ncbi:hypothetical protein E4U44_006239, partial [Claviceps purpurea]